MCHVSYMAAEPRPFLDIELLDKLEALRGSYVVLGSSFEPMLHPDFARIVRRLTEWGCTLEMVTNGTMLEGEKLEAILAANFARIYISFDGIRKETYEYIRRGSDHGETLRKIRNLRDRMSHRKTHFSVNSVIMRRNMGELIEMIDYWDQAGFDSLAFIYMVSRSERPDVKIGRAHV